MYFQNYFANRSLNWRVSRLRLEFVYADTTSDLGLQMLRVNEILQCDC